MPKGCEILPGGASDPQFAQPSLVEVVEAVGSSTTYSLLYPTTIEAGSVALLEEDKLGPEAQLAIRVADGDGTAILVRGPVTGQRISVVTGGDGSSLEVHGADPTVELAREARVKVWSSTTDEAAIIAMLGAAAITPAGVKLPTSITHSDTKHPLVQRESDLHLIRRLARRNGCWFWLTYDPATTLPFAHIARPPVEDEPAVKFFVAGDDANIDQSTIVWNVERIVSADSSARDTYAASDMDGTVEKSPLSPLAAKEFAAIAPSPRRARLTVPVDDAGDLKVRSEAALIEQGWLIEANLTASMRDLKQVVRTCTVAALHGVGKRHSGKYLVSRVVHRIDDDDHVMTITLVRNGWN